MATAKDISQEYENWLRLITLVDFAGRSLCRDVLFNKEKVSKDEVELFKLLKPLESKYVLLNINVQFFALQLEKQITVNLT